MTTKAIEAGARETDPDAFEVDEYGSYFEDRFTRRKETKVRAKACIEAAIASGELVPASAVAAERERCAQAAEGNSPSFNMSQALKECRDSEAGWHNGRIAAARLIRALEPASGEYVLVPRNNLTAMAQFIMWAMNTGPWDGCGLDGGDVQDKAEELGLILKTKHDPKIHGDRIEAESGDDWFVPPEWLVAMLTAATSNGSGK